MKSSKPTLILLDGNALLHRAWHAIPPLMTRDGRVVNAAYGFTVVVEKMLERFKPDYMVVAWDLPGATFRHEMYEPYKAQREKKADELYAQIPIIQDILKAYRIPSVSAEGFEADDIIGTLATRGEEEGMKTLIVTGDLDSLQLVDKDIEVIFFQKGISETKTYDEAAVKERFGLMPEQLIDYKTFRGDPSDNLPGVPGIGEKTAVELLNQFKTVEGVFKALKAGTVPDKYAKKLENHEKTAEQMKVLVTIRRDVPLPGFKLSESKTHEPEVSRILPMLRDLEFRTLIRKYAGETPAPPIANPSKAKVKHAPSVSREAKAVEKVLAKLDEEVGVLIATQAADLFGATMSAVAVSDGAHLIVIPNPDAAILKIVSDSLDRAKRVVTHDLKALMHATGWKPDTRWSDLMIGSYLLHSGTRAHDLASAMHDLYHEKLPELPATFAGEKDYLALGAFAMALPKAAKAMFERLEETKMKKVYLDIEMPLIPVLFDMETAGIEVDSKALTAFAKDLKKQTEALSKKIIELAGEDVNVNSPSQLATILFEKLDLPTKGIKKTQSGYSTAAPELEKLEDAHEIIPLIQEYRELAKLQSTYAESLPTLVQKDGRIHTTYNQTVAATGRLSSTDPNLQNIPIKTKLGNEIRKAFVAGKGKRLIAADYSQIELRLASVIAKDEPFITAFKEGADIHTRTAAQVWDLPEKEVTADQRRAAKAINFGILYGMGARSLGRSTGMSVGDAAAFIEKYFAIHHKIREYMDATKMQAHDKGYVETLFGRRRYLPEIQSGVPMLVAMAERMAINMPVQGTQADVVKLAMISVDHWLKKSGWPARLLLQVHDELVIECDADAVKAVSKGLRELMEGVANFEVTLEVNVESGKNWGEMDELLEEQDQHE